MKLEYRIGRYLLGDRLGMGGMGDVRLAMQEGLGRFRKPVAVKLLLPHLAEDPRAVEMFLEEAHLAARMSHPNIVQILDVGTERGQYYIAMELIQGVSLSRLIMHLRSRGTRLESREVEYVGRCLAEALHHAHEQRTPDGLPLELVHRDVTPQNLMVSVNGEVKLTDFGVAKVRHSSSLTRPGVLVGKLEYLAPEQLRHQRIDRRTDIYAAGITLYHLSVLLSPFHRKEEEEVVQAILNEALPPLEELRPDLSASLVAGIRRATEKNPDDRFPDALALRNALSHSTTSESAERLGATVRELCGEELRELEEKTRTVKARQTATDSEGRRWGVRLSAAGLAAVVVGAAVAGGAGLSVSRRADAPAAAVSAQPAPTSAPAPTPSVVAVPEPLPSRRAAEDSSVAARAPASAGTGSSGGRSHGARATDGRRLATSSLGFLSIDAVPWGTVWINGREVGQTPLGRYPVAPGTVSVVVVNPETGRKRTERVRVRAGAEAHLKLDVR